MTTHTTTAKLYERVTEGILADLRQGVAPWTKPWQASGQACGLPYNAMSNRPYSGVNILMLWATASLEGYASPGWVTFKQAREAGGHIRKGERGSFVVFVKRIVKEAEDDSEPETYSVLRHYHVFNTDQCEGLPERLIPSVRPISEPEGIENADRFLSGMGADVRHGGDRAYYSPSHDHIGLPHMADFRTIPGYYATSLHEHGHWTGHASRCDRQFGKRFGDQAYAAEELVAELTAAFLCAHLGIEGRLQHSEYIGNWIKLLESDKRALLTAASKASEASDYLRSLSEQRIAA